MDNVNKARIYSKAGIILLILGAIMVVTSAVLGIMNGWVYFLTDVLPYVIFLVVVAGGAYYICKVD